MGKGIFFRLGAVVIAGFLLITNTCFAVTLRTAVDNLAIKSRMVEGSISPKQEAEITSMFATLQAQLDGVADEASKKQIMDLWNKNLRERGLAEKTIEGNLSLSLETPTQIKITYTNTTGESHNQVVVYEGGKVIFAEGNVARGTQEELKQMEVAAMSTATTATEGFRGQIVSKAEGLLSNAVAAGRITQAEKDEIMNGLQTRKIILVEAQALGENAFFVAKGTTGEIILPKGMTDYTDLAIHEALEASSRSHEEVLKLQAAIHGIDVKDREDTSNAMGQTRADINKLRAEALANQEAKSSQEAVAVEVNKNIVKQGSKPEATTEQKTQAATEARRVLTQAMPDKGTEIAQISNETVINMVNDVISQAMAKIIAELQQTVNNFFAKHQTNLVTQGDLSTLTGTAEKFSTENRQLAVNFSMFFELKADKHGNLVPVLRNGALMALRGLETAAVKNGTVQIISAGVHAEKVKELLAIVCPNLGNKVQVNAGNEKTLEIVNTNPANLRVLYSTETEIAGKIAGVTYIQGQELTDINGFQVLLIALAPNLQGVSPHLTEDIAAGRFNLNLPGLDMNKKAYQEMQADYDKIVNLMVQA